MRADTVDAVVIAPHRFAFGFYRQAWWNWLIGTAFFLGEIGAGLFLVSFLTGHWWGMAVGYLIVGVGKNTAHLLYLGRPVRFWRAAMRPDRSWIARGIWATGVFMAAGFFVLFPRYLAVVSVFGEWGQALVGILAALSALFIMFYDGFVLKASRSIPFWDTYLLPLLCLTYATLGGTTLSLTLRELHGESAPAWLVTAEYVLLVTNLLLLNVYLDLMSERLPAARATVKLLMRGSYAFAFLGLVLLVGLVGTFFLSVVHVWTHWKWLTLLVAAFELTGDFALLMVLLKSGLYSPQAAPAVAAAS